jgi:hypothetical protein
MKMNKVNKIALVKSLVSASNQKFVSVTFKKKDGSLRTIVHNTKVKKGIKGAVQGKLDVVKYPQYVHVFDTILASKGVPAEKCWRTLNCETVISVRALGESLEFGSA